jgi:hypothetical protein
MFWSKPADMPHLLPFDGHPVVMPASDQMYVYGMDLSCLDFELNIDKVTELIHPIPYVLAPKHMLM